MSESTDPSLAPAQEQVLALLSAGNTIAAAAAAAGVHRNTIAYWRSSSPAFRQALYNAIYEKSLLWREHAEQLVAAAADSLRTILADSAAPAAVRVKAALAILDRASTPPPPFPDDLPRPGLSKQQQEEADLEAQFEDYVNTPFPDAPRPVMQESMHKNAQRLIHKVGRNEACPCGSGRKFKRCCAGNAPNPTQSEVPDPPPPAA